MNTFIHSLFAALFVCLFSFQQVIGQSYERKVLLEHFTNTRCGLCPARNASLDNLIEGNVVPTYRITYYPSVPYRNCVIHQNNPTEYDARRDYYNVNFTPQLYTQGTATHAGGVLLSQNQLDGEANQMSPLELKVVFTADANLSGVTVKTQLDQNLAGSGYVLHVAVVEKTVDYNAPNGETVHHDVMRKLLTGPNGASFDPTTAAHPQSVPLSFKPDASWDLSKLYILAFVQNTATKEIVNAGSSEDVTTSVSDKIEVSGLSLFPNPVKDLLTVSWNDGETGQLQLWDLTGKSVLETTGNGQARINTNELPSGVYYLQVNVGEAVSSRKILIQ
ncbi:MAG: T9SS type A sorting domain-containing protein [Bacteroidota bacterium]